MVRMLNHPYLSRRAVLGGAVALGALGIGRSSARAESASAPETWRTWLLISPDELRPSAPGNPLQSELDEVIALQSQRSVDTGIMISTWGDGPAVLPWTGIALDLIQVHQPSPVRAARGLALLHAAMADTIIAVRDATAAYPRSSPSQADAQIVPLGSGNTAASSFPSEHAAVAECAATVLAYLFPKEPADHLTALATEAAESRLWAGAAYRSDIEAGQVDRAGGRLARGRTRHGRWLRSGLGRQRPTDRRWHLAADSARIRADATRPDGRDVDAVALAQRRRLPPSRTARVRIGGLESRARRRAGGGFQANVGSGDAGQEMGWWGGNGYARRTLDPDRPRPDRSRRARYTVGREGTCLDQHRDGRRLHLLLGREIRLLDRAADHRRSDHSTC